MRIGPDNYRSITYLSYRAFNGTQQDIRDGDTIEHLTDYRFLLRLFFIKFDHRLVECDIEFNVYFNPQISICIPEQKLNEL